MDHGSWIANSWVVDHGSRIAMLVSSCSIVGHGSPCWFRCACRVVSWVVDRKFVGREFVGCALWCWVADGVIWCWVTSVGFSDEETEMRDREER